MRPQKLVLTIEMEIMVPADMKLDEVEKMLDQSVCIGELVSQLYDENKIMRQAGQGCSLCERGDIIMVRPRCTH